MSQEHPIAPPLELVGQWECEYSRMTYGPDQSVFIAEKAARWGADMELEACVEWLCEARNHGLGYDFGNTLSHRLRAARRPKPPNLKERGREALQSIHNIVVMETGGRELDVLKEIVESLPD